MVCTGCPGCRTHLLLHRSAPGPGTVRTCGGCQWLSWKQAQIFSRRWVLQAKPDAVVSERCLFLRVAQISPSFIQFSVTLVHIKTLTSSNNQTKSNIQFVESSWQNRFHRAWQGNLSFGPVRPISLFKASWLVMSNTIIAKNRFLQIIFEALEVRTSCPP